VKRRNPRHRQYIPSETHIALHAPRAIITCSNKDCGVKFAIRPEPLHDEDDPNLCLTCNRKSWSKLWEKKDRGAEPESLKTDPQDNTLIYINRK
jgi:hypothetical protein